MMRWGAHSFSYVPVGTGAPDDTGTVEVARSTGAFLRLRSRKQPLFLLTSLATVLVIGVLVSTVHLEFSDDVQRHVRGRNRHKQTSSNVPGDAVEPQGTGAGWPDTLVTRSDELQLEPQRNGAGWSDAPATRSNQPQPAARREWPDLPTHWPDRQCRWNCGPDDFLQIMSRRMGLKLHLQRNAKSSKTVAVENAVCTQHWWACADDKLGGYVFAQSESVRTPSILGYIDPGGGAGHRPDELTQICASIASAHTRFIMKPLRGQRSHGVWKYDDGAWTKLTFDPQNRYTVHSPEPPKEMLKDAHELTPLIFESFVDPPPGQKPNDYKFFVVGEKIIGVQIKFWKECDAYVNEEYERVDTSGCFHILKHPESKDECNHFDTGHLCTAQHMGRNPPPACWSDLVRTAKRLGRRFDTHMRIDFLCDSTGPVLGEFTPYHAAGLHMCIAPQLPNGKIDYCYSGRVWNRHIQNQKNAIPSPPVFSGWARRPLVERLDMAMMMTARSDDSNRRNHDTPKAPSQSSCHRIMAGHTLYIKHEGICYRLSMGTKLVRWKIPPNDSSEECEKGLHRMVAGHMTHKIEILGFYSRSYGYHDIYLQRGPSNLFNSEGEGTIVDVQFRPSVQLHGSGSAIQQVRLATKGLYQLLVSTPVCSPSHDEAKEHEDHSLWYTKALERIPGAKLHCVNLTELERIKQEQPVPMSTSIPDSTNMQPMIVSSQKHMHLNVLKPEYYSPLACVDHTRRVGLWRVYNPMMALVPAAQATCNALSVMCEDKARQQMGGGDLVFLVFNMVLEAKPNVKKRGKNNVKWVRGGMGTMAGLAKLDSLVDAVEGTASGRSELMTSSDIEWILPPSVVTSWPSQSHEDPRPLFNGRELLVIYNRVGNGSFMGEVDGAKFQPVVHRINTRVSRTPCRPDTTVCCWPERGSHDSADFSGRYKWHVERINGQFDGNVQVLQNAKNVVAMVPQHELGSVLRVSDLFASKVYEIDTNTGTTRAVVPIEMTQCHAAMKLLDMYVDTSRCTPHFHWSWTSHLVEVDKSVHQESAHNITTWMGAAHYRQDSDTDASWPMYLHVLLFIKETTRPSGEYDLACDQVVRVSDTIMDPLAGCDRECRASSPWFSKQLGNQDRRGFLDRSNQIPFHDFTFPASIMRFTDRRRPSAGANRLDFLLGYGVNDVTGFLTTFELEIPDGNDSGAENADPDYSFG